MSTWPPLLRHPQPPAMPGTPWDDQGRGSGGQRKTFSTLACCLFLSTPSAESWVCLGRQFLAPVKGLAQERCSTSIVK